MNCTCTPSKLSEGIISYQERQDESLMIASFIRTIGPYNAIACNVGLVNFNANAFKSVFDPLKHDIMVAFCLTAPDQYEVRLYTYNPDIDLPQIAKSFGGTGSKYSAAFQISCIDDVFNEEV